MAENAPPSTSAAPASSKTAASAPSTTASTATAAASAAPAADASSRGMPYYEKLRKDLRDSITRKRTLDAQLTRLEDDILRLETSYLEDTLHSGNIIKGFDGYMKSGTGGGGGGGASTGTGGAAGGGGGSAGTATRRKGGMTEADRIFSKSSAAVGRDTPVVQPLVAAGGTGAQSANGSTPGLGTPGSSHAATPVASGAATPGASGAAAAAAATGAGPKTKKSKKAQAAAAAAAAVAQAAEDEGNEQQRKRTKISYGRD